jgi:hypothetical protein
MSVAFPDSTTAEGPVVPVGEAGETLTSSSCRCIVAEASIARAAFAKQHAQLQRSVSQLRRLQQCRLRQGP